MKKFLITAVVMGAAIFVAGTAEAGRRPCRAYRTYAPVAVQPAPVATAQAQTGYRAFSYQPTDTVVRRSVPMRAARPGYLNAGTKASGRY
jgi:hypothetical protein